MHVNSITSCDRFLVITTSVIRVISDNRYKIIIFSPCRGWNGVPTGAFYTPQPSIGTSNPLAHVGHADHPWPLLLLAGCRMLSGNQFLTRGSRYPARVTRVHVTSQWVTSRLVHLHILCYTPDPNISPGSNLLRQFFVLSAEHSFLRLLVLVRQNHRRARP